MYIGGWRWSLLDVNEKAGGLLIGIERRCGLFKRIAYCIRQCSTSSFRPSVKKHCLEL